MNWPVKKLGDILSTAEIFTDGDWVESKDQDVNGSIRLLQLADIGDGNFINKSNRFINESTFISLKCTEVQLGDILIARMPDPLGRACIFEGISQKCITVVDVCIIRVDSNIVDARWLMHAINSDSVRRQISSFAKGATRVRISRKNLSHIQIEFPPLAEQQRIAALLDTADRILKQRESAIAKLDQLAQSVFVEMFGDVVSNNKNWNQLCINEIAANEKYSIVDGPFGSSLKPTDYLETGVPVIRIANVTKDGYFLPKNLLYISKEKFKELKRSSVCGDDVLVTRVGTIGNTCIFPNNFGDALLSTTGVCKIKPNRELVMPSYLHASIKTKSFQAQINKSASTSVQKYFNLTALKSWKISIPPLHLQNEFIKKINLINDEITKHQQCLHQIKNLEFSLQHQSFAVN